MVEIRKSRLAQLDIEDIWRYSYHKWGERQADIYFDELTQGINGLRDNPNIGKSLDQYRYIQINRHVIYYRVEEDTIHIIRVLHDTMLSQKYLYS